MKNIVIAAGYATRLGELTKNFPKPLLKIGNNTILGRMLDDIDQIPDIDEHIIITNHKFANIFRQWAKDRSERLEVRGENKPITIVDDGTETNETRLGAVCDLLFAMDKLHINDDMLVVAADNLLFFSFQEFVDFAKEKQTSCIMCHEQPSIEKLQRTGVVELDANNRVLNMEEKPSAQEPLGCATFLYLSEEGSRPDTSLRGEWLWQGCPRQLGPLHGVPHHHPCLAHDSRPLRHRLLRHLPRSLREIRKSLDESCGLRGVNPVNLEGALVLGELLKVALGQLLLDL